jgi:luciferase family oxidoreductase group 1
VIGVSAVVLQVKSAAGFLVAQADYPICQSDLLYSVIMINVPLSALDLALVQNGTSAADALAAATALARGIEQRGYRRLWIAEHHSAAAIASSSPAVIVGQIAAGTSTLRVGSGGVMLPNHAPLTVAEQFATLDAFHPRRIDLGIGRGPGTLDQETVRALRRGAAPATEDEYRHDVRTLLSLFGGDAVGSILAPPLPNHPSAPEIWLLSSSAAGGSLAGELGLPIAVAHHIRPDNTFTAIAAYREAFRPSRWLTEPHVLVCVNTICADTDERADELARPVDVLNANLFEGRLTGLPSPDEAAAYEYSDSQRRFLDARRPAQAVGSPQTVSKQLADLAVSTGANELMLSTPVYDIQDRLRSFELVASKAVQT